MIAKAQNDKTPTLTSIVAESFPHLRRGAMRDFLSILKAHKYYKDELWDKTNSVYTFENGSQIEFFSVDQPEKVRGARRERLFINEANNISFNAFEELEVRTKEFIILDWNPTNEFWYYEHVKNRPDVEEITLTYLDNEALDPEIKASIEVRKERKSWFRVYGLGLLGDVEGRIYPSWEILDEIPKDARLERRWLDFGYSNDPSAIGDIWKWNDAFVLNEHLYQKGLSNKQLAEFLLNLPSHKIPIIADSAEPKSIDEIKSFGLTVLPSTKGKDSVKQSTQIVQDQKIYVTKRSINIIKENRNMLWLVDKDGKILNIEDPLCANHHLSGIRYAMTSLIPIIRRKEYINSLPKSPLKPQTNPV